MLLETPLCNFGWKAPNFTLEDPDGTGFTMSDHLGNKALLIMFICNHCPYVQRITQRLAKDTELLMSEGINVLAVMSNDYHLVASDSPENMKEFATDNNFTFPYLVDHDQSVGRAYGAICTPDFFGLNKNGELLYRGRLDDIGMGSSETRVTELVNAMRLIAETDHGPVEQFASMGCSIKWR